MNKRFERLEVVYMSYDLDTKFCIDSNVSIGFSASLVQGNIPIGMASMFAIAEDCMVVDENLF